MDLEKVIWEGWKVKHFIEELEWLVQDIMDNITIHDKFKTKEELRVWLKDNQPYYKKDIPEVIEYFATKHKLE